MADADEHGCAGAQAEAASVSGQMDEPHMDFPRSIEDLHGFATKVLSCGDELSADHPGFTDAAYRTRRAEIAALARSYSGHGSLPHVAYTHEEVATWRAVYTRLRALFPSHACAAHRRVFPVLERECGYCPDAIPQLEDVSRFLRRTTGFLLRPVTGLLSSRDFLAGLAFRVFHATQYVRHGTRPLYTPEPDVCHELLGHVPLLADASFASFSQEIGLASLGASDAAVTRLATIYWFTVEFGLCAEDGGVRAYGAGVLSSYGELLHALPLQTASLRERSLKNVSPLDANKGGECGALDVPLHDQCAKEGVVEGECGALDVPLHDRCEEKGLVEGECGALDVPVHDQCAKEDIIEGECGALDVPLHDRCADDDMVEGESGAPEHRALDVAAAAETPYPVTCYQPVYFVASSFEDAQEQVRAYATRVFKRPFVVRVDPWTRRATVVEGAEGLRAIADTLRSEVAALSLAVDAMAP